ncbi:putative E3 ubiquitin-protein ligase TRIM8 [Scleropages formosus]|uniref:E3 ubiquitin-protein ligase TRIM8 n=1 Tax=Scleropages formosus TaxID=113540 RepID=A0A0P7V668_SCLFO|nr:putative E3 ubiquitin-protein ligase TRIM8 [Scleropages formosus]
MADSWKSCLEEELICPICLHVFVEPVQLPCKHNFCRACISEAWSKDGVPLRCPECNHAYGQKPPLEKNLKLTNIVDKFNALDGEKTAVALQCILCRRGPPLPAHKVCLRCNAPCCQSHVQTHLQQPSPNPGHFIVDVVDLKAWTCPQHGEYRLYHCEAEHAAVCQYCCFSRCASSHGHAVCDVDVRRNDIRQALVKQQDRMEEHEQDVEEQLYKLESDKQQVEDQVQQLKEEVRVQYQKMHQLLKEDLSRTLEMLDKARSRFCQENSSQALQLHERHQEVKKLLSSIQIMFDKTEDVNFMKNTKSVKVLMDRSKSCIGNGLPPHKVGHLNSKLFLMEVSKREKNLRKMLEVSFSVPGNFLQCVEAYPCSLGRGGAEKRKHSTAFPDAGFLASSPGPMGKQPYLGQGLPRSGSVFPGPPYPAASPSQQYGSRKVLMCTVDNCYCSGTTPVSGHRAHGSYPRSNSFPWTVNSQEYPPLPSAPNVPQPLQGLSVRDWLEPSPSRRTSDLYGLYGQSSSKHYVTS